MFTWKTFSKRHMRPTWARGSLLLLLASGSLMLLYILKGGSVPNINKVSLAYGECFHRNMLCERSSTFSYLMESLPSIARSWTPCHEQPHAVSMPENSSFYDDKDHYEVNLCVQGGDLRVNVIHHNQDACMAPGAADMLEMGLSPTDAAKDFVEVLLAGPERRLQRMEYIPTTRPIPMDATKEMSCTYELSMPIRSAGTYRVQVLVVHSNITLETFEPYRNYVLWDRLHSLISNGHPVDENNVGGTQAALEDPGIWSTDTEGAHLLDYNLDPIDWPEDPNIHAYRCPFNGTSAFKWTPRSVDGVPFTLPLAIKGVNEARQCVRSLLPSHDAAYPKLVLFGDSMMRQTFDALAIALGMENVKAVKEFKSLMESQDWGGPEFGAELCFQWSARYNEGRRRCESSHTILLCWLI